MPTTSFSDQTFEMTSDSSAVATPDLLSSLLSSLVGSLLPTSTVAISDGLESVLDSILGSATSDIGFFITQPSPTSTSSTLSHIISVSAHPSSSLPPNPSHTTISTKASLLSSPRPTQTSSSSQTSPSSSQNSTFTSISTQTSQISTPNLTPINTPIRPGTPAVNFSGGLKKISEGVEAGIAVGAVVAIVAALFMWRKLKRRKGKEVETNRVSEVMDLGPGPYEMASPGEKQNGETIHEMAAP